MSTVKAAVIQMELKADPLSDSFDTIRDKMTEAHMALIEDSANQGVQVVGLQEVWTMPYFQGPGSMRGTVEVGHGPEWELDRIPRPANEGTLEVRQCTKRA